MKQCDVSYAVAPDGKQVLGAPRLMPDIQSQLANEQRSLSTAGHLNLFMLSRQ